MKMENMKLLEIPISEYQMKILNEYGFSDLPDMFFRTKQNIELLRNGRCHVELIDPTESSLKTDLTRYCTVRIDKSIGRVYDIKEKSVMIRFPDNQVTDMIIEKSKLNKVSVSIRGLGIKNPKDEASKDKFRFVAFCLKIDE